MKLEVSIGEAIDKYSILELKLKKIEDEYKKIEIRKEIEALTECLLYKQNHYFYYNLLTYVNETIWDMTNDIKKMSIEDPKFAIISNQIFEFNQKRFRIKNWFNMITCSNLNEQKSYASTHCKISIDDKQSIFDKIAEIHYLSLEYDKISFETPHLEIIQRIFTIPTFIYEPNAVNILSSPVCIRLDNYLINDSVDRNIFELIPITYLMGGLFGDFIQSLSVVNEKFYKTGRKGIIYISNKGHHFNNGIENTYNDTYSIIKNQNYIKDYIIFNNHTYDIDLTSWRDDIDAVYISNPTFNWMDIYKNKYNIDWGYEKWLTVENNDKWKDSILVNTTNYRWPNDIDFNLLQQTYENEIIFIGSDIGQYQHFIQTTSLNIPFYNCSTFYELSTAIHSCKLFVGSLSAPLAIAHACHKDRIIGLNSAYMDRSLNNNLDRLWNNIKYSV